MAWKPTDTVHLNLRYPEALRRRLERAAKNSRRSMNTEIVERLEQSFRRQDFEKLQDAINMGWLQILSVVADVQRHLPPQERPGLLDIGRELGLIDEMGRPTPASVSPEKQSPAFTDKDESK